jgi:acetyl-CoA carboxylase, biotin carboxylase subunit
VFKKILIANRGEIALRVLRAARELGVKAVVAYSQADETSLPVLLADESICIGPPASAGSYLNVRNLLSAALVTGAEAIHPGYGFLAENAEFAEMCEEHHLTFIGPRPENIARIGDKARARALAVEAGVPITPGSDPLADLAAAHAFAAEVGYPVILKASAGGGGRGMRVVQSPRPRAQLRAGAGGGARRLRRPAHVPRALPRGAAPRRDPGVRRRRGRGHPLLRPRLLDPAPLPEDARGGAVDPRPRAAGEIAEAAVRLARHIQYRGAGTCEFLVDREGRFYFSEMNTRIQVEHPSPRWSPASTWCRSSSGWRPARAVAAAGGRARRGHAIEVRVNAEDPDHDFRPSPGVVTDVHWPGGPGIRVDSHVYAGYRIPPNYDSLIAKIIAWGPTRAMAIARMERALRETVVEGVATTIPFHLRVLDNAFYRRGAVYTNFIARRMSP